MSRTIVMGLAWFGALLTTIGPAACKGDAVAGGTVGGAAGSYGGSGGAAGCRCEAHGGCGAVQDPEGCDYAWASYAGAGGASAHRWQISDSTCSGVPDGTYCWSPTCSPEGRVCVLSGYSGGAGCGGSAGWSHSQWPTCGQSVPCEGLPFSLDDGTSWEADPSCDYQCTAPPPSGDAAPVAASCVGPEQEPCALAVAHIMLL